MLRYNYYCIYPYKIIKLLSTIFNKDFLKKLKELSILNLIGFELDKNLLIKLLQIIILLEINLDRYYQKK